MVSSIRKQGTLLEDLPIAIPRILMALLIAIVLIVPIELRLFEPEIEARLPEHMVDQIERGPLRSQIEAVNAHILKIKQDLGALERQRTKRLDDPEGGRLQETLQRLSARIEELKEHKRLATSKAAEFKRQATEEAEGTEGTGIPGKGPHYRTFIAKAKEQRKNIEQLTAELASLRKERDEASSRLDGLKGKTRVENLQADLDKLERKRGELHEKKQQALAAVGAYSTSPQWASLLTRLMLVRSLAQENATIDWTSTLLRLLVILLELSPIILRLLSPRGAYDALRDAAETEEVLSADLRKLRAQDDYDRKADEIRARQREIFA